MQVLSSHGLDNKSLVSSNVGPCTQVVKEVGLEDSSSINQVSSLGRVDGDYNSLVGPIDSSGRNAKKARSFPLLLSKIRRVWSEHSKKSNSALFRRRVAASIFKGAVSVSSSKGGNLKGQSSGKGRMDVVGSSSSGKGPNSDHFCSKEEATKVVEVGKLLGVTFGGYEEDSLKQIKEMEDRDV